VRTHRGGVGLGQNVSSQREVRLTFSNTRLRSSGLVSETQPHDVTWSMSHCNVKRVANLIIKLVHVTINTQNTMEIKESKDALAQKAAWQAREKAQQCRKVAVMKERIRSNCTNGINPDQKLSAGEKGFCRRNEISFS